MKRFFPALALVATTLVAAMPAAAQQKLLPAQSQVEFTARQMGVPLQGRFTKFDAKVAFNPAQPQASQLEFTIDTASATMGARETDAELPKANWFNVAQFPQARFVSQSVKALGGGRFDIAGQLHIKGTVRDVVLPVQLVQKDQLTTASGNLTLKRLQFKIGDNEWADTSMVADEVQVRFALTLTGVGKL